MNTKRIIIRVLIFILSLVFINSVFAKSIQPTWEEKTVHDLHQMHNVLVNNTMEYIDHYPPFMIWLERGLKQSLQLSKKVKTQTGYDYALAYYANGFNNAHLSVFTDYDYFTYNYAGMLLNYQNGKYKLNYVDPKFKDLPPLNAELISCDGVPVQTIIDQQIISFSDFHHNLESSNNRAANYLFFDANPFRSYARKCVFEINNKECIFEINWQKLSTQQSKDVKNLFQYRYPFRIQLFGDTGLWISIPTLSFNKIQTLFFKTLLQMMPDFRSYDPIVFDVRGNGGGNDKWAYDVLSGLYGKDFIDQVIQRNNHSQDIYRVTKNNLNLILSLSHRYSDMGELVKDFQSAYKKGETVFISTFNETKMLSPNSSDTSLFKNHVYFLTDNNCSSACLNFADYIHWLPNTTQIGLPTSADSVYTENAEIKLTYGAILNYAVKVIRNRPRGTNVPYIPKYRYTGKISDTPALMKWVEQLYKEKKF